MTYVQQTWNDSDPSAPVSAARLNHIEAGLGAVANGGSLSATGDVTITSDSDVSGAGDIVLMTGSTERGRIKAGDGKLYLKKEVFVGTADVAGAFLNFVGNSTYANTSGMVWQCGLDTANTPAEADFFLCRAEGGSTVADFFYIKNGRDTSNSAALGINQAGTQLGSAVTNPSFLRVGRNSGAPYATNDVAWHNVVLAVADASGPAQTGHALVVSRQNDALPFVVTKLGETLTRKITNLNLTDSNDWTNDKVGALFVPIDATGRALIVRGAASQSSDIMRVCSSSTTLYGGYNKNGYWFTGKTTAPATGDLSASQMILWLDATNGAGKVMASAKTADGTLVTATVAALA